MQIWDSTRNAASRNLGADKGSGGLWNNSPGTPARIRSSWRTSRSASGTHFRIIQIGARTTVYLNGKLVVDHAIMENFWDRKTPSPRKGPIQLQTHGGEIRWRNINVREIPADEANTILAKPRRRGLQPIFDGKDLDGWAGPIDQLPGQGRRDPMCKPGKGGHDLLQQGVRPISSPASSSGSRPAATTAWRSATPARATPPTSGMCELQVLDDTDREVCQARPAAVPRLGLRHGPPPSAATSARSASGTSRK